MKIQPAFINTEQAAELLNVPVSTIYKVSTIKGFPAYRRKARGPMQFIPDELVQWWRSSSV